MVDFSDSFRDDIDLGEPGQSSEECSDLNRKSRQRNKRNSSNDLWKDQSLSDGEIEDDMVAENAAENRKPASKYENFTYDTYDTKRYKAFPLRRKWIPNRARYNSFKRNATQSRTNYHQSSHLSHLRYDSGHCSKARRDYSGYYGNCFANDDESQQAVHLTCSKALSDMKYYINQLFKEHSLLREECAYLQRELSVLKWKKSQ